MTKVKLLTDGGYTGIKQAVGKTFFADKFQGHWNIDGEDLKAAGCTGVCMESYAFFQREVEVVHALC